MEHTNDTDSMALTFVCHGSRGVVNDWAFDGENCSAKGMAISTKMGLANHHRLFSLVLAC